MTNFKPRILNMLPNGNFTRLKKKKNRENEILWKKYWVPNELIQQMSTIKMPCKMKWALIM